MPSTPNTEFNERILNSYAVNANTGIAGVIGLTERGPLNKPSLLIKSWPEFQIHYGNEISTSDFPTLCRRALEAGTALRISGVKHQSDVGNPATIDATKSTPITNLTYTLSAALTSGKTISFDPWAGAAYTTSQAFSGSALATLNAFAQKLKNTYTALIEDVIVDSTTKITIIPKAGAAVGDFTIACSGAVAPTVTEGTAILGNDSAGTPVKIFNIVPKYYGNYSKLKVQILPASNGSNFSFDLAISMSDIPNYVERYKNLTAQAVAANAATFLSSLDGSSLVAYTYENLSAYVGLPKPAVGTFRFGTGSLGSALTDADLVGNLGLRSGIYAFNGIYDIFDVSFLLAAGNVAEQALANYASGRKDITAIHWIPNAEDTDAKVVAYRDTMGIDSSYSVIVAGGLTIIDALQPNANPMPTKDTGCLGDVLGISAVSAVKEGAWKSPAGTQRGIIKNAVAVVNNHLFDSAEYLAQNQINIITQQNGLKYLWHSFTAQREFNPLSFWNVRRMLIELKKALRPIVSKYHEEPNDIPSWLSMYNEVKPTLEDRVTQRAIFDYEWMGDQFANTLADLTVNTEVDVRAGKYKVRLRIKEITSMQDIFVDIELSPSGVSFESSVA